METPRDNKDLPSDRGVGHFHRLQGRILPHTNSQSVQEVHAFSHPGSVLPVQSPTLWSVHSTYGVHSGGQRGQTDGLTERYKNPPIPRRLVGESHVPPNLSPAYTDLGSSLSRTRVAVNEKSELDPKQVFNFVGYQFNVKEGKVRPTPEHWQTLTDKILSILSGPVCPVREFMSLIGLLTATEKQVHLGQLHMRLIQWHLKNNWRVPESLEKVIPGSTINYHSLFHHFPQAWAVDALSLSWENLDPYAFPPAAILGKVVEKLQDYPCNRIILIAPGWPNMPWFWALVAMSSEIPLCLPNLPSLVSQPFNQTLHRNLSNLNLHAWLLEPQQSRSRRSLRQWQHELRLLRENQPALSMSQSGPFLQSGASVIRWTSGHHL